MKEKTVLIRCNENTKKQIDKLCDINGVTQTKLIELAINEIADKKIVLS